MTLNSYTDFITLGGTPPVKFWCWRAIPKVASWINLDSTRLGCALFQPSRAGSGRSDRTYLARTFSSSRDSRASFRPLYSGLPNLDKEAVGPVAAHTGFVGGRGSSAAGSIPGTPSWSRQLVRM